MAINIESHNSSKRMIKNRMLQKLSAPSRQRRKSKHRKRPSHATNFRRSVETRKCLQKHWDQAYDTQNVAEAKKTETHTVAADETGKKSVATQSDSSDLSTLDEVSVKMVRRNHQDETGNRQRFCEIL